MKIEIQFHINILDLQKVVERRRTYKKQAYENAIITIVLKVFIV